MERVITFVHSKADKLRTLIDAFFDGLEEKYDDIKVLDTKATTTPFYDGSTNYQQTRHLIVITYSYEKKELKL